MLLSLSSFPSLVFSVSLSFPPPNLPLSGSCWGAEWSQPGWSHLVFISLYSPFTFFSHRKPIWVGCRRIDWLSMGATHTCTPFNPVCPLWPLQQAPSFPSPLPHSFHDRSTLNGHSHISVCFVKLRWHLVDNRELYVFSGNNHHFCGATSLSFHLENVFYTLV